ncbi:hypothetical protein ACIBQ1_34240 [Nonomuraea sp. NPDC050153]|uniref:hypothetical protein n=1 Tax=Nonomuraea sp. NPDC050153 TaxID=3364359 RepID=UPI0037AB8529
MAAAGDSWELEPNWPGLVADRDVVEYDDTKFDDVVIMLEKALSEVSGDGVSMEGSLPDVKFQAEVLKTFARAIEKVGEWDGGVSFVAALKKSHEGLTTVYSEVNEKLAIAVKLIAASAESYKQANTANER